MAKEKRKINLNIEQKRFLLKMLDINSIEEIDTAILKQQKLAILFPSSWYHM